MAAPSDPGPSIVIVAGAPGEDAYSEAFRNQLDAWEAAARQRSARVTVIGRDALQLPATPDETVAGVQTDLQKLEATLAAEPREGPTDVWLVLCGHGTFDGRVAKFNLRGPDLTADDLASWLRPVKRRMAVIVAASSSAPFLAKLSAPDRVVVVATRSGYEQNYSRFGEHFARAITDEDGDLDRDGQVSLLEAFLTAAHRTAEFYRNDARLMTEHALIDDNGDGLGTPADWFRGTRAVKRAREGAALDGARAHQWHLLPSAAELSLSPEMRARRNELELRLEALRAEKASLPSEEYSPRLEAILLELARLYEGT